MEKIIVVISPSGIERMSLEFACYLSRVTESRLTALFLHQEPLMQADSDSSEKHFCHHEKEIPVLPLLSKPDVHKSKADFEKFCANHNLQWTPELQDAANIKDVILESRFSDLMIIDAGASFSTDLQIIPSDTVTYILKHAECPVIVAPLTFDEVNEIVFTYDGSESSVFAIKQFTYLFPQFNSKKITFLEVNDNYSGDVKYKSELTAYLELHYSSVVYQILGGSPEDEIFSYLLNKSNVFVVMGAFGKKVIPSILKRSTANLLLKTTSLPVFISHK